MAGSWLKATRTKDFSISNIPFGIISSAENKTRRPAIAIGDFALDLPAFAAGGGFKELSTTDSHVLLESLQQSTLNAFASLGRPVHKIVRRYLQQVLDEDTTSPHTLKDNLELQKQALLPLTEVQNHLPLTIGDYTDFFAGRHHAFTVGSLFRGPANALQPNYHHLPVGYHGRASSVVVSGTPIRRPRGQTLANPTAEPKIPTFTPSKRLDIELELAVFICKENELGETIPISNAKDHIFGYVIMNDWSARDIQTWEYVPLGPFNAKNFGTTVSAWVVLADALEIHRTNGIPNEAKLQDYLKEQDAGAGLDILFEVTLTAASGSESVISRTSGRNLMWSFPQMIAHHAVGGCPMRVGDLLGSGTISGLSDDDRGSLLEMSKGGKAPIKLADGSERIFLQDGDTITIRGFAGNDEKHRIGFGDCSGTILAAAQL